MAEGLQDDGTFGLASDFDVFNHHIRLTQISSDIIYSITLNNADPAHGPRKEGRYHSVPSSGSGLHPAEIYAWVTLLHGRLKRWRKAAPFYAEPRCVYQKPEFFEHHYQKERLYLYWVAIDRLTSAGPPPPLELLRPCADAASKVVKMVNTLMRDNYMFSTRRYTYLIFSCGLVIVFTALAELHPADRAPNSWSGIDKVSWWGNDLEEDSEYLDMAGLWDALAVAKDAIGWLADKMPDMAVYAQFLSVLVRELSRLAVHQHEQRIGIEEALLDGGLAPDIQVPSADDLNRAGPMFDLGRHLQATGGGLAEHQSGDALHDLLGGWLATEETGADLYGADSLDSWPLAGLAWTGQNWEPGIPNYDWDAMPSYHSGPET